MTAEEKLIEHRARFTKPIVHGTHAGYKKCYPKCKECRTFYNNYMRVYMRKYNH